MKSKTFWSITLLLAVTVLEVNAQICDFQSEGNTFSPNDNKECSIFVLDSQFSTMLNDGDNTKLSLRLESTENIYHEGPVLFDNVLYFVTNRLGPDSMKNITWGMTSPPLLDQFINIMKLHLKTNQVSKVETSIMMANGMTKTTDGKNLLVLSQGFNTTGGGVYELNRETLQANPVVTSLYGKQFNSPNDIETTRDGIIFFSDPPYGFEQGFRSNKNPVLGSNVYRYDTSTKMLTLVSTMLQRPNGVALFDDRENGNGCTLFLSDTGFDTANFNKTDVQLPRGLDGYGDSALYTVKDDDDGCFAAKDGPWVPQPLTPATKGIQDGMEVHHESELLFYCDGDGLWIWSIPLFKNIGLVRLEGGCTQVMFSQDLGMNNVFILAEKKLYEIPLKFEKVKKDDDSIMQWMYWFLLSLLLSTLLYLLNTKSTYTPKWGLYTRKDEKTT